MVQGYHEYQSIWDNPLANGGLPCKRETENSHDPQAVTIKKVIDGTLQVVGYVPRNLKISSICLIFVRRGGSPTLM